MSGFVSLVGAGPGDPDLLTVKAMRRLAEADLVLFDALVPDEMLEAASGARLLSVGKRAGRPSVAQEAIHRLMIREARRGQRIVRLKCGDPFVLGRGGEEALALAAAGIPFEVVPGLSTAISAPELSGIPVTHRGAASGFVVVSGHAEAVYRPVLDALPPGSLTIVVLMGLGSRRALAQCLIDRGWRPSTPAAVCVAAGTAQAHTWIGTLDALGTAPVAMGACALRSPEQDAPAVAGARVSPDAPGTIVVGDVVSVGASIAAALYPHASSLAASQAV